MATLRIKRIFSAEIREAVCESFKNPGVRLGYISIPVFLLVVVLLPLLGQEWNFVGLCAGLGSMGVLACTPHIQYEVVRKMVKPEESASTLEKFIAGVATLLVLVGLVLLVFLPLFTRWCLFLNTLRG